MASTAEKPGLVDNFKQWACSFSGCDGGDLKSPVWLCGIEWGFSNPNRKTKEAYHEEMRKNYSEILPVEIAKGAYKLKNGGYFSDYRMRKFIYVRNVAKLYGALKGMKVEEVDRTMTGDWKIFHMNLYPIAFRRVANYLWDKYGLAEITGFESKHEYMEWCRCNRFPWFAEKIKKNKPNLIVGTGVSFLKDFVLFCGGTDTNTEIHHQEIVGYPLSPEKSTRTLHWAKIGSKTTLAVIPFPIGPYGLNSNALLQKFGDRIREIAGF